MRNDKVVKQPADPSELTQIYTDEAIDFIERNKEEPFFLYLPHTMLHKPLGVVSPFEELQTGENTVMQFRNLITMLVAFLKR